MKTIFYTATKTTATHVATVNNWLAGYNEGLPVRFDGRWFQVMRLECVADGTAYVVLSDVQVSAKDLSYDPVGGHIAHLEKRILAMEGQ